MQTFFKSYCFGSTLNLTEQQLQKLICLFNHPAKPCASALGGRCAGTHHEVDGIGSLWIKHYMRGGLMRLLSKKTYFRLGKTRAEKEFTLLQKVKEFGVNTPDPVAYAFRGRLFYIGWLVTRFIPQSLTLARFAATDEKQVSKVMPAVVEQVARLIRCGVYHVDLHPGNVLIDHSNQVYLVDFDKGYLSAANKNILRDRYLNRWHRAINKHSLPVSLSELMQTGLDLNFENAKKKID
jgi:3-deoxy-D-manno-octulosonic acid kinase